MNPLSFRRFLSKQLAGPRLSQYDAVSIDQRLVRIPRQQGIAKETEEIFLHTINLQTGFPVVDCRISPRLIGFGVDGTPVGHFRITAGQAFAYQVIAGKIALVRQDVNVIDILYIVAHGDLPHDHVGNEQHEHQGDAQSCHIDQRKQFVALEISKISFQSFHRILGFEVVIRS